MNHPGPTQYYLAKVPDGKDVKTWDGAGAVWFKISTTKPKVDAAKQMTWPGQSELLRITFIVLQPCLTTHPDEYKTPNATIPAATPAGDYLLRVEHIALHMASQANKAQFYLSCSQIKVTGGGSGSPGPLVAFPGAYKSTDPGILVNLGSYQDKPDSYPPPGPEVWSG